MKLRFTKTETGNCQNYIDAYEKELASPIDSFLEEHIMESQMYFIEIDGINGVFAEFIKAH